MTLSPCYLCQTRDYVRDGCTDKRACDPCRARLDRLIRSLEKTTARQRLRREAQAREANDDFIGTLR